MTTKGVEKNPTPLEVLKQQLEAKYGPNDPRVTFFLTQAVVRDFPADLFMQDLSIRLGQYHDPEN